LPRIRDDISTMAMPGHPAPAYGTHLSRSNAMLDYLRIMLNARTAKMSERGASAVEYGLLIAGIAALIVVVVFAFGGKLSTIFTNTCKSVASTTSC
jgi:pilus assembly protein Flp/PilA